jgi:hypothetical protein
MGAPGRIIRPVGEKDLARMAIGAESYRRKAADYARLLKVVDRG